MGSVALLTTTPFLSTEAEADDDVASFHEMLVDGGLKLTPLTKLLLAVGAADVITADDEDEDVLSRNSWLLVLVMVEYGVPPPDGDGTNIWTRSSLVMVMMLPVSIRSAESAAADAADIPFKIFGNVEDGVAG